MRKRIVTSLTVWLAEISLACSSSSSGGGEGGRSVSSSKGGASARSVGSSSGSGGSSDPMKKEGAIVLGTGGDNSFAAVGDFFEGAMTATYTTSETDDAVQANIVAAGYGR